MLNKNIHLLSYEKYRVKAELIRSSEFRLDWYNNKLAAIQNELIRRKERKKKRQIIKTKKLNTKNIK